MDSAAKNQYATARSEYIASLNDALAEARNTNRALTEVQKDFRNALVGLVIGAELFSASVALESSVLSIIGIMTATLGLAAALPVVTILGVAAVGILALNERELASVKLVGDFTNNPFSILAGTLGAVIDGERGFEVGTRAGDVTSFIFASSSELSEFADSDFAGKIMHAMSLRQSVLDLPSGILDEPDGRMHFSSYDAGDLLETEERLQGYLSAYNHPIVSNLIELTGPRAAEEEADAFAQLDSDIFGSNDIRTDWPVSGQRPQSQKAKQPLDPRGAPDPVPPPPRPAVPPPYVPPSMPAPASLPPPPPTPFFGGTTYIPPPPGSNIPDFDIGTPPP